MPRPMCASEESPRPIPQIQRPPDSACSVVMADAVTAASRVRGLVTPVPSFNRVVCAAARLSCPYGSGLKFWVSGQSRTSNAICSIFCARTAVWPGETSMMMPNSRMVPSFSPVCCFSEARLALLNQRVNMSGLAARILQQRLVGGQRRGRATPPVVPHPVRAPSHPLRVTSF